MKKRFPQFRKFFRTHWFNLLSLIVAAIAVILAFQANRISEESARLTRESYKLTKDSYEFARQSEIKIFASEAVMVIYIGSCFDSKRNLYVLSYETGRTFGFTNRGGSLASLVDVRFWDGKRFYHSQKELIREKATGMLGYIDIIPGQAQEVSITKRYVSSNDNEYTTKEKAQEAFLNAQSIDDGYWEFLFSDGGVSRKDFKLGWLPTDSKKNQL